MRNKRAVKRLKVSRLGSIPRKMFGPLITRSIDEAGLFGDISILHEHMPPYTRLPTIHHRRTAELVFCVSGKMTAYLDGRRYRVRAGGIILIPPGVRHQFVTAASECAAISIFSPSLTIGPGADISKT